MGYGPNKVETPGLIPWKYTISMSKQEHRETLICFVWAFTLHNVAGHIDKDENQVKYWVEVIQ